MGWALPPTRRSYPVRGEYVKFLRERRGWTQDDFARLCGYSERLIRKAEGSDSLSPDAIADLADALSESGGPVFPEDLVSDPLAAARLFIESYDLYEQSMLAHCSHIFHDDVVLWCAGAEQGIPFAGTFQGMAGLQEWLDRFFSIIKRPARGVMKPAFSVAGNEVIAKYEEPTSVNGVPGDPLWIVNITKFERGKIIRIENYFDTYAGHNAMNAHGGLPDSDG